MYQSPQWLERTELLIGAEGIQKLSEQHVLVIGLGGVGSFAAEFLARAGIGHMTIVDGDTVDITNINRQLQATHETIGQSKAELIKQRILSINPEIKISALESFLDPEGIAAMVTSQKFDFILDCIDSLQPKVNLLITAFRHGQTIISSMGAGGKTDPSKIHISDLAKTHHCNFASMIRKRLKRDADIKDGITAVFSPEPVSKSSLRITDGSNFKKSFYGTISYMPALFGLTMASIVIRRVIEKEIE
jgi:tRNA threonylcarbamoyladenosine dehydratase